MRFINRNTEREWWEELFDDSSGPIPMPRSSIELERVAEAIWGKDAPPLHPTLLKGKK